MGAATRMYTMGNSLGGGVVVLVVVVLVVVVGVGVVVDVGLLVNP